MRKCGNQAQSFGVATATWVEMCSRSCAAPFPFDATLDGIQGFFASVAPVNCVRMRRHLTSKDFRGSVFVEFGSEDHAREARALSSPNRINLCEAMLLCG